MAYLLHGWPSLGGRRYLRCLICQLREVRLGYTLPNRITRQAGLFDVSISAVGRNLALWTDVPHIDPETSSTSGGTVIPGVESVAIPSTRSWGINFNCRF